MICQNRMLLVLQLINRVSDSQMLLTNQYLVFHLHHYCPNFFQFFYHKKKAMLTAMTLSESTLFREDLIKVIIHLIKHTLFINFGNNGKDNFRYQICSSFYEWAQCQPFSILREILN